MTYYRGGHGESAGARTQDQRLKRMFFRGLQWVAMICMLFYKWLIYIVLWKMWQEGLSQGIAKDSKKKYHKSITLNCMLRP